jgi:hypothetical protein
MESAEIIELDATGLQCPMPLLKAKRGFDTRFSRVRGTIRSPAA